MEEIYAVVYAQARVVWPVGNVVPAAASDSLLSCMEITEVF